MLKPKEEDNTDCHLQQVSMGTLTCRAIVSGEDNDVDSTQCFNCDVGKIYRDVGCDAATARISSHFNSSGSHYFIDEIFCKTRRCHTTLEYCKTCTLVTAETTRELVSKVTGLFQAHGFDSAYKDIEKARESFRDGNFPHTITSSLSCVESVLKIIHTELDKELPKKRTITTLWKSGREFLNFDQTDNTGKTLELLNNLAGVVGKFGALRSEWSDSHGRDNLSQEVSEIIAELAINTSATLSTTLIRQFMQVYAVKDNE